MTATLAGTERWTDRAAIDEFVRSSPQGTVFARPVFLDALDLDWEFRRLGSSDQTRAAAVLFRDPAGQAVRGPLPFCMYQGILLPPAGGTPAHRAVPEQLAATSELLASLQTERRLSWTTHPSFTDLRALSWFHYHEPAAGHFSINVRYTGLIDLQASGSIDAVLAASRSVRRQEYRKAGARFLVGQSDDIRLLDRLHAATFARQGIERPDRERALLASIAQAVLADGCGELLVATDERGTPAGAVLFLFDEKAGYYLVAANDPAYRSAGVSTLLLLRGIERCLERGVGVVDLVGMNSPARGDFKTSFGAVPVPYFVANWERP